MCITPVRPSELDFRHVTAAVRPHPRSFVLSGVHLLLLQFCVVSIFVFVFDEPGQTNMPRIEKCPFSLGDLLCASHCGLNLFTFIFCRVAMRIISQLAESNAACTRGNRAWLAAGEYALHSCIIIAYCRSNCSNKPSLPSKSSGSTC